MDILFAIIALCFLIMILSIPIFIMNKTFKNMDKKERQDIKRELKNPLTLLSVGFICIGLLLFSSGSILKGKPLQHIGMGMIMLNWFTMCIVGWRKQQINLFVSLAFILLGITGIVAYNYFI